MFKQSKRFVLALFFVFLWTIVPVKAATTLEVHFIDVGQADSIYFKLPNGQNMLIDAGNNADGSLVVNYLQNQGVTTIDYLVGTHPHEDHIGGLDDVIYAFNIGKIYMPYKTATTQTYYDVLTAIDSKNLTITTATAGLKMFDTVVGTSILKADILSPIRQSYSNTNDNSVVIKLAYGATSYLMMGDAETLVENELLSANVNLKADVLKVGHHGSHSSTSQAFLDAVQPKIGVISAGLNNSYGHPHTEVVDRLIANNIDVYRTDLQGTIVTTSDGQTVTSTLAPWYDGNQDTNPTDPTDPVDPTPTNPTTILINEVMPAPQATYTQEWVELYNPTSNVVDLSGYILDDIANGGSSPYTLPTGTTIDANGFYVVYLNSAILNNSGDDVRLLLPDGSVSDTFTYGTSAYDLSWAREVDGGTWLTTQVESPTPGVSNSGTTVNPSLPQEVMINEFLPAPQSVYTQEWVEIYNPTASPIDLSGYQIDDIENGGSSPYTIPMGTTIEANGYYVVYFSSAILNNTGDDVRLIKPDGTVIDQVTYSSSSYDQSWYRETDGGIWSVSQDSTPTPNADNTAVTEPITEPTPVKGGGKKK